MLLQQVVESMKAGGWLCMECGTAAPQFGNFTGDSFPLEEILKPNFGKKEDFGGECGSSLSGLWIQRLTESDCTDTGVGIGIEAQLRYNK